MQNKKVIADIIIPYHDRIDLLEERLATIDQEKFNVIVESGGTFAENCNQGARKAITGKLIFLNDDVEIGNDLLMEMIAKKSDIVGVSQVIDDFPGVIFGLGLRFGKQKLETFFAMNRDELFLPSGFCFLIKRRLWESLGGFNEEFKNGHEDVDLFLRAIEADSQFAFIDRPVKHLHSQSLGRNKNDNKNEVLFLKKWNDFRMEQLLNDATDRLEIEEKIFKWKNLKRGIDKSDFGKNFRAYYFDQTTEEIEFNKNTAIQNKILEARTLFVNFEGVKWSEIFDKLQLARIAGKEKKVFFVLEERGKFFKINPELKQTFLDKYQNFSLFVTDKEVLAVSFIAHSVDGYGAEKSLVDFLRMLVPKGVLAQVIMPRYGVIEAELVNLPIMTEVIGMPWNTRPADKLETDRLKKMIFEKGAEVAIKVGFFGAELIVSNTSVIDEGAWAAKMLNLPHIWRVLEYGKKEHGINYFNEVTERIKFINQYSEKILFPSEGLKDFYRKEVGFKKLVTVPEVFDLEKEARVTRTTKKYFKNKEALKILIVGNLAEGKHQEDGILALNELKRQGQKVELLLAGGYDEAYLGKLKRIILENSLGDDVSVLGYCSDIKQLMWQTDIVLSCSVFESFGRVLVEAMACGKAVVGANSGGTKELIKDGENGFLYEPSNYCQLADKLAYFIENPQAIVQFGKIGYNLVKERFQVQDTAKRVWEIFREVNKKANSSGLLGPDRVTLDYLDAFVQETVQEAKLISIKCKKNAEQEKKLALVTNSKFWKMRGLYLKLKQALKNPQKFLKKVLGMGRKSLIIFKEKGWRGFWKEVKFFLVRNGLGKAGAVAVCKDFLFISGCYLEMPQKYRCDFQKEQLEKHGLSGDFQFFTAINQTWLKYYDVFIFYRTPITLEVAKFIKQAKKLNKLVIFDIDDLVFDENLVKDKHEFKAMNAKEKKVYLDGIRRHRETMELCDFGIASTETIAEHMRKIIPNVLVNRNSVPDVLAERSKVAQIIRNGKEVVLGYFSGSKTHDDDLKLIEGVLVEALEKYPNVKLMLVGPVSLSEKLSAYENKIIRNDFVAFEKLPELIAQIDINLLPLVSTEFNNGKSEIKYTEAALVKRPTIASTTATNCFAIKDGETGFLAENLTEWREKLFRLIENKALRVKFANRAYRDVLENYNTFKIGQGLVNFINNNRKKKIVYVSPSVKISGGVMVVGQHLKMLQNEGFNVSFIACDEEERLDWIDDFSVPIIPSRSFQEANLKLLDIAVATLWSTLKLVQKSNAKEKYYFVQNKEHFFYARKSIEFTRAKTTYDAKDVNFITMSRWCQRWLKDEFGQQACYIPNGISVENFHLTKPIQPKDKKTRILIEGNPDDNYKNVDEAFRIVEQLDKKKFEIWFISYGGQPKQWYSYDESFNKIPYKEMKKYYSSCDILLKTSRLESFSYPPLEMMACGGVCVVAENGGNAEYIKNEYNALTYQLGDLKTAVQQIERLAESKKLREKLLANGKKTVKERAWSNTLIKLKQLYAKKEN